MKPTIALAAIFFPITAFSQQPVDLWTPAGAGDLETLREGIATGADLNAREPNGQSTPLMIAAIYGETDAAKLLIDHKAELDLRNKDGSTIKVSTDPKADYRYPHCEATPK